ncbi:hypothetical protein [Stenotrophomonas sp.]|uniref:hypothetical protein n=1 Tax=Stenotrophomonas sp. TaxID=69392 RepID=UPI0028A8ED75|nr:hypothetical protein [Stenotrophomonas sp.]
MHDWTLVSAHVDWINKLAEFKLLDDTSVERVLRLEAIETVTLDCREHWGPSNSVNNIVFVEDESLNELTATIEIQSGGKLVVTASLSSNIGLPQRARLPTSKIG